MERAEAAPRARCSAEGVNRKDEFESLGFRYGLRKGIMPTLPGSPRQPEARGDI